MSVHDVARPVEMVVVAIDVGKNTVALSVTDDQRRRLLGPVDFAMTRAGLAATVTKIEAVVPSEARVRVGVEAAGHYHQPLLVPSSWPAGWELRELNPGHVSEQRRVQGWRRVKTDAVDLEAITELVLSGQGSPVTARAEVLGELGFWVTPPAASGRDPDGDEEPAAGSARSGLPGVDAGVARRAGYPGRPHGR